MPFSGPPSTASPILTSSSASSLPTLSSASSANSIPFSDLKQEPVIHQGLPHSDVPLNPKKYKSTLFLTALLDIIGMLKVPTWDNPLVTPDTIKIFKVSGSLTNAVFFVSTSFTHIKTLLLRIYGPSSGSLISRSKELHILHMLSSKYNIGPAIYGTFGNGRLEEYFDSTALTASDMRDPVISRWIGARMAELHCVDLDVIQQGLPTPMTPLRTSIEENISSWLPSAQAVLDLPTVMPLARQELDLTRFSKAWAIYLKWISAQDDGLLGHRRVFAHNDAQYGNLLRLAHPSAGLDQHQQIIVVDFEYASPNPAAFDIANHFHEWTADYHGAHPHILTSIYYPTKAQRCNFISSYLQHLAMDDEERLSKYDRAAEIDALDKQVRYWSPASHAMWSIWGIVQAREHLVSLDAEADFDYIGYARCRMTSFYAELYSLGVNVD